MEEQFKLIQSKRKLLIKNLKCSSQGILDLIKLSQLSLVGGKSLLDTFKR